MTPRRLLRSLGRAARSVARDMQRIKREWQKALALVERDPEDLAGTRALTAALDLLAERWQRWHQDGLARVALLAVEPDLAGLVRWVAEKAQAVRDFEVEHHRDLVPEQRKLIAAVRRAAAVLN